MNTLSKREIFLVVNDYIGVTDGYLDGFSYRVHEEFYPRYCDLTIDVNAFRPATTREAFIKILETAPVRDQAKILRGVLEMRPVGSFPAEAQPKKEVTRKAIEATIHRLEGASPVATLDLAASSAVVQRAIADAELLVASGQGAVSAVDRIHTVLHGHLKALCANAGLAIQEDSSATSVLKTLVSSHPEIRSARPRQGDVVSILRAMGTVVDAMNPIRNRASVAHPTDTLLEEPEAMLVINAAKTILHYLDARLSK